MKDISAFVKWAKEIFKVKIVDLTKDKWKETLYESLEPQFIEAAKGSSYPYAGQDSFEEVIHLSIETLHARTAVIEPYISTDWNAEYSSVYSRTFAPIPQYSQRIHFFGTVLNYEDLFEIGESAEYLGYCVMRPLQAFRVGDTVLAAPCTVTDAGGNRVHCLEWFRVSLLGSPLKVLGMPFLQQDTTVGVCAHADLWMVARYLNKKGEVRRYRPPEIAGLAASVLSLGPPRAGLFDRQMLDALVQMGLSPVIEYPASASTAKEFIYSCIESELPVITGIPEHVVVVIGHTYDDGTRFNQGIHSMSEAVDSFIAHDDAAGPYQKLRVGTRPPNKKKGESIEFLTLRGEEVDVFIVSFPKRVHMYWEDARDTARLWIDEINQYATGILELDGITIWDRDDIESLVLRSYLRLSSDFKADLLAPKPEKQRNWQIIARYKCMQMPKYIWVVELSRNSDLVGISFDDRKIRGEIILDSTGNRHVPEETLLAFHLDGKMFIPRKAEKPAELIVVDSTPYSPLLRSKRQR
jgi:hypothetical protein